MSMKKIGRNYQPYVGAGGIVNNNSPALWDEIISRVTPFLPEGTRAVVAGGAVRDYVLSFAPKDIDVFLVSENPTYPVLYEVSLSNIQQAFPSSAMAATFDAMADITEQPRSLSAYGGFFGVEVPMTVDGITYRVQIIIGSDDTPVRSSKDLLDKFDYGLVRAVYDPLLDSGSVIQVHTDFIDMSTDGVLRPNKKLSKTHQKGAAKRFKEFRRRNGFFVRPPTEWISTEGIPEGFRATRDFVVPEGYTGVEIIQDNFANRSGEYRESAGQPMSLSLPQASIYRYNRKGPGHADILRYRFIDYI